MSDVESGEGDDFRYWRGGRVDDNVRCSVGKGYCQMLERC